MEDPFLFRLLCHLTGQLDLVSFPHSINYLLPAEIIHFTSDQETQISVSTTKIIALKDLFATGANTENGKYGK